MDCNSVLEICTEMGYDKFSWAITAIFVLKVAVIISKIKGEYIEILHTN